MQFSHTCGWVEVITGCMHAGKTTELRRRLRQCTQAGQRVALFSARLDTRYEPILAVDRPVGEPLVAHVVRAAEQIARADSEVEVVGIEEAHFLDGDLVAVCSALARRGVRVIVAGLDTDFRGDTFGPIGDLLAQAERVTKLYAICAACGGIATRTQRLQQGRPAALDQPTVQTATEVHYEARCRACHLVPSRS